jgi:hypothetical protein
LRLRRRRILWFRRHSGTMPRRWKCCGRLDQARLPAFWGASPAGH